MKKILLLLMCVLIYSCASTRKVSQTTKSTQDSVHTVQEAEAKTEKVIDTTKVDNSKIVITEIEFYPPTPSVQDQETTQPPPTNVEPTNIGGISLNLGIKDAAIKSIKQTTIEASSEQKGESKESGESKENKSDVIVSKNDESTQTESTPVPDPYRWRYIFYIALLATIVLLYLKRVPILNWIKKILAGIRLIF